MDPRVAHLAARQHGVVGRRQLFRLGLSVGEVDGLVRRDRLRRGARGVYVAAGAPPTPLQEPMIAALRCGPAARIVGPRMVAALAVPHVDRYGDFAVVTRPGRRVRSVPWRLRHDDAVGVAPAVIDGVPSYNWRRLAAESVVALEDDAAVLLLDHLRWWRRDAVDAVVGWARTHPASRAGRRLLDLAASPQLRHESPQERVLARVLEDFALEFQVEVLPGVRVDAFHRAARIVIEYDGHGPHGGAAQKDRDRRRRERLEEAGYLVVTVVAADLADPGGLRRRIAELVRARTV